MPRGREPEGPASPARRRSSAPVDGRWAWRASAATSGGPVACAGHPRAHAVGLALGAVLAVACSGRGEGTTRGMSHQGRGLVSPWADGIGRVANDVRGIDAMPDYDAEAQQLRARVERDLPHPLPSPAAACTSMLDGARAYYQGVQGEGSAAVATLAATRQADHDACLRETSPAAAACVAVMIANEEGEFPWLLDQCSRAFPRAEG